MTVLLLLHALVAAATLTVVRRRAVVGAWAGVAVMSATAASAVVWGVGADEIRTERFTWVADLGLRFSFRLDAFAVTMVLVVAVLGALVLAYATSYFDHDATFTRFTGVFVAFAGAMTGLVLSDDLFTMFVFWELTSVSSFLLIGLDDRSASARASALRALLVTGAGGLCLLGGVVLLQVVAGTTSFSELAADTPSGTVVQVAIMLVLVGAFTKSAQFPFHFWLPGAMAAPTPVSAYLHSATMVKAGIVLMARMAPIFGEDALWRWAVVIAGGVTMILGGARALRQTDAKLLLAHSTVSQLGFLTMLVGLGVPGATYAGVAHLVAHAVFKAGLFLGVGAVDHAEGTRDIRRLNGVGARMPVVAVLMALLSASMAGLIPMFGFATKEKGLVALLDAESGAAPSVALAFVVVGSVLSAAYSLRLWLGVFTSFGSSAPAEAHAEHDEHHHAPGLLLVGPVALLGVATAAAGVLAATVGGWLKAPAHALDADASGKLALWPGVNTALLISFAVLAVGAVVGRLAPVEPASARGWRPSGERAYQWLFDGLLDGSRRVTAITQSGSLVVYIGVVFTVLAAVLAVGVLDDPGSGFADLVLADSALQVAVVLLAIAFAVATAVVPHRFTSALLIGGVGYAIAVLFALYGAPDLALTQVLVETLTIVVFLLALRHMPQRFDPAPSWAPHAVRLVLSVGIGVLMSAFAVLVAASRTAPSSGEVYTELSYPEAGGNNVVNVILVDFRGWDTMGEIVVLATAALGVANLVRMAQRAQRAREADAAAAAGEPPASASATVAGEVRS